MPLHAKVDETHGTAELGVSPVYGGLVGHPIPRHQIPARSMPPDVALQLVRDELMLDGNARLNLATFVTTWMEPQAGQLMTECFSRQSAGAAYPLVRGYFRSQCPSRQQNLARGRRIAC